MKNISPALQAHLAGELTTLATIIKITRTDGVVKAFTTHDRDLVIGGVTYLADGAMTPSAIDGNTTLASGQMDIAGVLDTAAIADGDIKNGLYDHAVLEVGLVNWADLSQGVLKQRRGWLGEITLQGGRYQAELRGLHDLLQRDIGTTYTAECRHDLGDSSCTYNIAAATVSSSVTLASDAVQFIDTARSEASGSFNYGKLVWTSGANTGLAMEVKNWDLPTQTMTLWLPMPNVIAAGDGYTVYPGCDKRFSTCKTKFNNASNFGGFPHLPGLDKILTYPDSV